MVSNEISNFIICQNDLVLKLRKRKKRCGLEKKKRRRYYTQIRDKLYQGKTLVKIYQNIGNH